MGATKAYIEPNPEKTAREVNKVMQDEVG